MELISSSNIKKLKVMAKTSFAEVINGVQVMTAGMANNESVAQQRGWIKAKNAYLTNLRNDAILLNDEQERLKAELKMKTAELDAKMAEIKTMMIEAKKVVKLGFPQEQWKEFGITSKR